MKTFKHDSNLYIVHWLPRHLVTKYGSLLGKTYTLESVCPCSYTYRCGVDQLPGDVCGAHPGNFLMNPNFSCPGKIRFLEEPFNKVHACWGWDDGFMFNKVK